MRAYKMMIVTVLVAVLASSCVGSSLMVGKVDLNEHCQKVVGALEELRSAYPYPERINRQESGLTQPMEGEFDPNLYFEIFAHLSMPEGRVLDYVYYNDGMGGFPMLYARGVDEARTETEPAWGEYLDEIVLDGSPESYLEYLVLRALGGQFYLFWHANYSDQIIVCGDNALEQVDQEMSSFGNNFPAAVRRKIKAADTNAWFAEEGDFVKVRFASFSKWGGLYEETFTLEKGTNTDVVSSDRKNLVEYEIDLMF